MTEEQEIISALRVGVFQDLGVSIDEQSSAPVDLVLAYSAALRDSRNECESLRNRLAGEERRIVQSMLKTAVNCGRSSQCAVAGWYMESIERGAIA